MAWKPTFNQGITSFKELHLDEALCHFSKALKLPGGDRQHIIYDSRAAVYEKLGKPKEALRDAKNVIKLAQDQWQGYARAARLFLLACKYDASLSMADMALARIKVSNSKRRDEISKLRHDIVQAQQAEINRQRLTQNQFAKLPVELLGEVFRWAVSEDATTLIRVLRVCSYWRDVAWTAPALWATLILTSNSPMRKLSLWLKQSKHRIRELHIRSDVATHVDWPFPELADIAWDKLRVCSAVSWDLAGYVTRKKLGGNALASLEALEMVEDRFCRERATPGLFPLLQRAGVRCLSFSKSNFSWKSVSKHLTSLTSLSVFGCSKDPQVLLAVLEANPGLQTLKILDHFHYKYSAASPVSLSHLTHLELHGSFASSLLKSINIPNQHTLIIRGSSGSLDSAFKSFISNKNTKFLTHLVIDRCSISPSILTCFLEETTALARLELLALSQCANTVIESLAGPIFFPPTKNQPVSAQKVVMPAGTGGTPIICPALTHINVSYSSDVRTGPLVRLVKSRLSAATASSAEMDTAEDFESLPSPKCVKIISLIMDQCHQIEAQWLPWFRENVSTVSCVYEAKKKGTWK